MADCFIVRQQNYYIELTLNINDATKRIGNFFKLPIQLFHGVPYPELAFIAYLNCTGGTEEVGLYQSGYTVVVRYMGVIFSAVTMEFYTRLASSNPHPHRQIVALRHELLLLTGIITPLLVIFIPFSPLAIRLLYSSEFLGVTPYMFCALPGMLLHALPLCISYLILARGDGRTYVATETTIAILSLIFNITGYRLGGLTGLGIAFTASHAAYSIIMLWVYLRNCHGTIPLRLTAIYILAITAVTATSVACMHVFLMIYHPEGYTPFLFFSFSVSLPDFLY